MPNQTLVYVLLVLFVATLIRSTLGFGEGFVHALAGFADPCHLSGTTRRAVFRPGGGGDRLSGLAEVRCRVRGRLLVCAVFGIPLGFLLLTQVNDHLVKMLLGLVILSFSVYSLAAKSRLHLQDDHPLWLLGEGSAPES